VIGLSEYKLIRKDSIPWVNWSRSVVDLTVLKRKIQEGAKYVSGKWKTAQKNG
jgi:hypothetical protein